MDIIEYTALKYYNSCISEECLYLGMLFNSLIKNARVFKSIRSFKRLKFFDDEINTELFKDYLCSIKAEIEDNIFNYDEVFNLKGYIKPYISELRFSSIRTEKANDPDFIENMVKLFLKFDYDKKQRLSRETEKKYIKKVSKSSHIDFSGEPIIGKYNESIRLDLVTDNYGTKLFKFEGKGLTRLVANVKAWACNAREMKDAKKIVFLYDVDFENPEKFDTVVKILKEDAFKVVPHEAGIDYIANTTGNQL